MAYILVCKDDGEVQEAFEIGIAEIYDPDPHTEEVDDFFEKVLNAIEEADG